MPINAERDIVMANLSVRLSVCHMPLSVTPVSHATRLTSNTSNYSTASDASQLRVHGYGTRCQ